ncbi:EspA/EspE family type VII secretion system effector [Mycolicibacterium mucogenicum]|uniref:TPR repeat region-containing protein n=1 Tax=Mycolicibacterium mucogenicum TaxID=56689 RepID=UPI002269B051|nr:EspA/EspE family type VII secretion system effector [Mycolicibacterium mucogenicum]MCX8561728.1 EspA/EspE family type VII secretion system effector [Mycolicibacterium mucogenicum]
MGIADAFDGVWNRAYGTYGQGTPKGGEHFDKSTQFREMQDSVKAAAPDDRWQGTASQAYDKVNKDHGNSFGTLADLDKRYAAEIDKSAAAVATGRRNLETIRASFMASIAGLDESKPADRALLMKLTSGSLGQIQDTMLDTTKAQAQGGQRMNEITAGYAALGDKKLFGPKEGLGEGKDDKRGDKDDDKKNGLLDYRDGQFDGEALRDGKLTPEQLAHLHDASTLTKQQLDDLAAGKTVNIDPQRMAYLNQLMRPFDGMTPAQIKEAQSKLPDTQKAELAQAFSIVSNPNVKSGMPSTGGYLNDYDPSSRVPAAGSLSNLPSGLAQELSRPDRVTVHTGEMSMPSPTGSSYPLPHTTELKGIGALQDSSEIFKPAGAGYTNGSEATHAMLQASSQYALADSAHRGDPGSLLFSDQHGGGTDPRAALADVVQSASGDHVSIHDLATKDPGNHFLEGLTKENWGDQSGKVGSVFQWMGDDPHSAISSETANSVAHFISDHKSELQHMPGGGSFGSDNQELSQAVSHGVGPYLASLAGADHSLMDSPGIKHFTNPTQMADLFSVLDTDHKSGEIINNAALQQQQYLETRAAAVGIQNNEVEVASRLHHSMVAGALDAQQFDQAVKQFDASQQDAAKAAMWDTGPGALGAVVGMVPGGQYPAAVLAVLNPEMKMHYIHTTDPTTVAGTDYLTRYFSDHDTTAVQQTNILNGMLASDPSIKDDPLLAPYVTAGQLDPSKFDDGTDRNFNVWLRDHGAAHGYDASWWAQQAQWGETKTGWADAKDSKYGDHDHK